VEHIVIVAAEELVTGAAAAVNFVQALIPLEPIGVRTTIEEIVVLATAEPIKTGTPLEMVVPRLAE
jgi:hypothetical protein